jgi:hypothetical protein
MEVGQGPNWGCSAKEKNMPILFFGVSCKLQISVWIVLVIIININTHKRECENMKFILYEYYHV